MVLIAYLRVANSYSLLLKLVHKAPQQHKAGITNKLPFRYLRECIPLHNSWSSLSEMTRHHARSPLQDVCTAISFVFILPLLLLLRVRK